MKIQAMYILFITLISLSLGSYAWSTQDFPDYSSVSTSSTSPVTGSPMTNTSINSSLAFSVVPKEASVNVDDMFIVNVTLDNVVDMYAWQVHLYFDPAVIECMCVSVPRDYVFSYAGDNATGRALVEYNSTEFRNPVQRINNNWVLAGDTLLGEQPTFTGSGILCQVEFKAISPGSSPLTLSTNCRYFGTYVLQADLELIVPKVFDGIVNVPEQPKLSFKSFSNWQIVILISIGLRLKLPKDFLLGCEQN